MKRRADHIVFLFDGSNRMKCDHCGATRVLALPAAIQDVVLQMRAFSAGHRHCKPPPKP